MKSPGNWLMGNIVLKSLAWQVVTTWQSQLDSAWFPNSQILNKERKVLQLDTELANVTQSLAHKTKEVTNSSYSYLIVMFSRRGRGSEAVLISLCSHIMIWIMDIGYPSLENTLTHVNVSLHLRSIINQKNSTLEQKALPIINYLKTPDSIGLYLSICFFFLSLIIRSKIFDETQCSIIIHYNESLFQNPSCNGNSDSNRWSGTKRRSCTSHQTWARPETIVGSLRKSSRLGGRS
jgi:hypothetical protein